VTSPSFCLVSNDLNYHEGNEELEHIDIDQRLGNSLSRIENSNNVNDSVMVDYSILDSFKILPDIVNTAMFHKSGTGTVGTTGTTSHNNYNLFKNFNNNSNNEIQNNNSTVDKNSFNLINNSTKIDLNLCNINLTDKIRKNKEF